MTGPDLCPKCSGLHFKTSPCVVRRPIHSAVTKAAEIGAVVAEAVFPKRPVGRPKTITDMKAYKAERARKYRADKKAAKASTHSQAQLNTTRD